MAGRTEPAQGLPATMAGPRATVEAIANSKIREVANAGMGLADVIALWYGEPDLPTPEFICRAAADSLARGETFYTPNLGVPALRETLADYMSGLYGRTIGMDRIVVTASGMAAVNLMQQVLTEPGDNVVVTGPIWPNLVETIRIMGGEPRLAWLGFGNDGWTLDLERLFALVDGRTRAVMVNSPANPTGWVMGREKQRALLDFCRERGLWLIADEVYARLYYDGPVAPSFLEVAEPEDRLVVINSFSKAWCMTGWRLGWITAPADLLPTLEKMIEFHYSCPTHFGQVAGIAAVRDGEDFVRETVARYRAARDLAIDRLQAMPRVRVARPAGAFYAFFEVDGMTDSTGFCKRLLQEARVGLAPGAAFGPQCDSFIRLCFASTQERLETAMGRLAPALA